MIRSRVLYSIILTIVSLQAFAETGEGTGLVQKDAEFIPSVVSWILAAWPF